MGAEESADKVVVEPEVVTVTVMVVMLVVLVRPASLSAVVELVVVSCTSTEVEVQGGEAAVVSHELVRDVEKLDQRVE